MAVATSDRNHAVALAAAERNQTVELYDPNDPLGDGEPTVPYNQADYDSAVAQADSQRKNELDAAAKAYGSSHAAAAGTRRNTIAAKQEELTAAVAAANQQSEDYACPYICPTSFSWEIHERAEVNMIEAP